MKTPVARTRFFAHSALAMMVLTLLSFTVTYFMPLAAGTPDTRPLIHVHAAAFFAWIFLYAFQAHLVATGRTPRHRELGLAALLVSGAMIPLGWAAALAAVERRRATGDPLPWSSTAFNVVDMSLFALMIALAVITVTRRPDWHRRFMFGAAITLLGPAMSRLFIPFPDAPPFSWLDPALLADLFFVALIVHDRRTLGRVHVATLVVTVLIVGSHWATYPLKDSAWWNSHAPALARFHTTAPKLPEGHR